MKRRRPNAPKPSPDQADFIDRLGGPKQVAEHLTRVLRLEQSFTPQGVSMWKRRGIPYGYRHHLVRRAQLLAVRVPDDFFSPETAAPSGPSREPADDVPPFLDQA